MVVVETKFDICDHDISSSNPSQTEFTSNDNGNPYFSVFMKVKHEGFSLTLELDSNLHWQELYSNPYYRQKDDDYSVLRTNGKFHFEVNNTSDFECNWQQGTPSIGTSVTIPEQVMLPEIKKVLDFKKLHTIPDGQTHCEQCRLDYLEYEEYKASRKAIENVDVPERQ